MSNSGWIETGLGSWEWWYLSFATGLAVHGLARFNRRAARRQAVDADLRARHRSLSTGERHRGRGGRREEEEIWRKTKRKKERKREGGRCGGGERKWKWKSRKRAGIRMKRWMTRATEQRIVAKTRKRAKQKE
jgi:hypothetical protein